MFVRFLEETTIKCIKKLVRRSLSSVVLCSYSACQSPGNMKKLLLANRRFTTIIHRFVARLKWVARASSTKNFLCKLINLPFGGSWFAYFWFLKKPRVTKLKPVYTCDISPSHCHLLHIVTFTAVSGMNCTELLHTPGWQSQGTKS